MANNKLAQGIKALKERVYGDYFGSPQWADVRNKINTTEFDTLSIIAMHRTSANELSSRFTEGLERVFWDSELTGDDNAIYDFGCNCDEYQNFMAGYNKALEEVYEALKSVSGHGTEN